jgi:Ca-activated chloride channel family protein
MERDIQVRCTPNRSRLPAIQEPQLFYLLVELIPAGLGESQSRLPLDICMLLDNSSSMRGDRLFQAREAARYIVNQLTPEDYFCLITFNDHATVAVPRQAVHASVAMREHISEVQASGGTEMARGMEQALEQMLRVVTFSGVRRIILLTDGQTYGDENRCVELARQAQQAGIGLTALGVGDEWNEDLMATMAAHGNSRSEYIVSAEAIITLFREEMRLLQGIVAQELSLEFHLQPQISLQSFFRVAPEVSTIEPHPARGGGLVVPLGEWMGSDAQVFLAELMLPALPSGEQRLLRLRFSYRLPRERHAREGGYDVRLPIVQGLPKAADEAPDKVRRALEKVTAFRLQESAWREARRGNIEQATRRLNAAASRLLQMGEHDLARVVEKEAEQMGRTGRTSAIGKKEIVYGTQRLGRRRDHELTD